MGPYRRNTYAGGRGAGLRQRQGRRGVVGVVDVQRDNVKSGDPHRGGDPRLRAEGRFLGRLLGEAIRGGGRYRLAALTARELAVCGLLPRLGREGIVALVERPGIEAPAPRCRGARPEPRCPRAPIAAGDRTRRARVRSAPRAGIGRRRGSLRPAGGRGNVLRRADAGRRPGGDRRISHCLAAHRPLRPPRAGPGAGEVPRRARPHKYSACKDPHSCQMIRSHARHLAFGITW